MDADLLSTPVELPLKIDEAARNCLQQRIEYAFRQTGISYLACTFPIEEVDPLACLEKAWNNQRFHYYWEKPSENFAITAGDSLIELSASGNNRFQEIDDQRKAVIDATATFSVTPHSYAGLMFLGGFSFFSEIENSMWDSFEAASLTVPEWLIFKDDKYAFATVFLDTNCFEDDHALYNALADRLVYLNKITSKARAESLSAPASKKTNVPSLTLGNHYQRWATSIENAKKAIKQGSFEKIVLARKYSTARNTAYPPTSMLAKLRHQYPNCSCFLMHPADGNSFLGATPEQLASFQQQLLMTEALAGSIERGHTAEEDSILENNLSLSSKNRQEHQFVVRDIEERLQAFTTDLRRPHRPEIKKLSNVQHLYTPIRAELKPEANILSIVEQLHPTPAVGGFPREQATSQIREMEDFERGWFAGPIGWLNAKGSGEFAVAIRSGLLTETEAHFFAGCGIVEDSEARTEWKETNLKLKPMLSSLNYD